ncbi:hypothetical protein T440DRAFT_373212, partial [Plenodomus tracheiphilus IPT5]
KRLNTRRTVRMDDWVQQSDISARLVEFDPAYLHGLAQTALSSARAGRTAMARGGSSSSMMAAGPLVHVDALDALDAIDAIDTAASLPSLCSHAGTDTDTDTDATPTATSISTGLASHLAGVALLEERSGILTVPPAPACPPIYECAFWFLGCGALFAARHEWETHCLSHFRGQEPPRSVQCPLCAWSAARDDGAHAWHLRMQHLADAHTMRGQTLRTSRPDFRLFQHLWQKRLIDDHDLKELQGGNHNLTRLPGNYVETNVRPGARRRDRASQRTQHVAANRQPAPRRA